MIPIEPERLLAAELPPLEGGWTVGDVLLYHLAIGAGDPPTDPQELAYAYEGALHVLPSFGVVPAVSHLMALMPTPVLGLDLTTVLHGEQEVELRGPLPATLNEPTTVRVADVFDKVSGALVVFESDTGGIVRGVSRFFIRGAGGFGGDPGPSSSLAPAEGPPAWETNVPTLRQQALLYRLTGDRNPLHADPDFARAAGFERPILHGMCTYGIVCKAAVEIALGGDPSKVASYRARFTGVVYPGETLRVAIWPNDEGLRVEALVVERDIPVMTNGLLVVR